VQSVSLGAHALKGGCPRRGLTPRRTDWPSGAIDFDLTTDSVTSQKTGLSITPRWKPQNAEFSSDFCHVYSTAPIYNVFVVANCACLSCNAVSSGISLQTFRDNLSVQTPRVKKSKEGSRIDSWRWTDKLSRNFGKELPLFIASQPRRAQISSNSRRKPEITCFFSVTSSVYRWRCCF